LCATVFGRALLASYVSGIGELWDIAFLFLRTELPWTISFAVIISHFRDARVASRQVSNTRQVRVQSIKLDERDLPIVLYRARFTATNLASVAIS